MTETNKLPVKVLLAFLIAAGIPLAIWGGFVFSKLWEWFVVPLGLQPLGVAHAVGLMATGKMLRAKADDRMVDYAYLAEAAKSGAVAPLAILIIGWIASKWM